MPKNKSTILVNGEQPKKKSRSDAHDIYSDNDEDDEEQKSDIPQMDLGTLSEVLFREMKLAAKQNEKYSARFDFSNIQIDGYTSEQLKQHYDRLRSAAFRNIRHLPLSVEIDFVRKYAEKEMKTETKTKLKRPANAYMRFHIDTSKKLFKKRPELKGNISQLGKTIGDMWKKLSPEERRPYEEATAAEMEVFFKQHPELQTKKGQSKSMKQKNPKSAFELFSAAKGKEYEEKYGIKGEELKQKMALKFSKLSDRKRQKWEDQAKTSFEEYVQQLSTKGSQQP